MVCENPGPYRLKIVSILGLRILYITNKISPAGGLEKVLSLKTRSLVEHFGYEVHMLTLNQGDEAVFHPFHPGIRMHDIRVSGAAPAYIRAYATGIRRVVEEIRPDLVDVCDDGLKAFFVPLILPGIPVVYERHVSKAIEFNSLNRSILKRGLVWAKYALMHRLGRTFRRVVVLTPGNAAEWPLPNLEIIPNPLTLENPGPAEKPAGKRVIAAGRHSFQKGFDLLLHAWKKVQAERPDWELTIYGTPDPALGLERLRDELGLSETVRFFDPVKTIGDRYRESAFYVLSSRFEGFGLVLTEAMACGLPCVSFDCPAGPGDIIEDGKDGFLVPPEDAAGLADRMLDLMRQPELRVSMGQNALKKASQYGLEEIMGHWDRLFHQILRESHG